MEHRLSGVVPQLAQTHLLIAQAARPAPASVVDAAPAAADPRNDPGADTGPRSGHHPGMRSGAQPWGEGAAPRATEHSTAEQGRAEPGTGAETTPADRPSIDPPPSPDQPTGPPPTFEANLLEVEAARRRASLGTAIAQSRADDAASAVHPAEAAPTALRGEGGAGTEAPAQAGWPRFDAGTTPAVDVTR